MHTRIKQIEMPQNVFKAEFSRDKSVEKMNTGAREVLGNYCESATGARKREIGQSPKQNDLKRSSHLFPSGNPTDSSIPYFKM